MAHVGSRLLLTGSLLVLGVGALALLPADRTNSVASATASPAAESPASATAPNPKLLQALNAALVPPSPDSYALRAPANAAVASVLPATAAEPAVTPDASSLEPSQPPVLRTDSVGSIAVNLRAGPSGSVISVLNAGVAVSVIEANGGWIHVHLDDGRDGWVYSTYLTSGGGAAAGTGSTTDTAAPPATPVRTVAANAPRAVIQSDGGDLENRTARFSSALPAYSRPGDSEPSIFTFQPGDEVRIAEVRGDWLEVQTDNGITAWIRR
jgi:SH3-like domain-containing protein